MTPKPWRITLGTPDGHIRAVTVTTVPDSPAEGAEAELYRLRLIEPYECVDRVREVA